MEVEIGMKDALTVFAPIIAAIIMAVSASVFTRRKYDAEIRGMDATTDSVAVANIGTALAHQGEYIARLEERLTRTELAEQTCRSSLYKVQIQLQDLQQQLRLLQPPQPGPA